MARVLVYEALAKSLKFLGVETLFGLMGDANLWLINEYVKDHGGNYVSATHEANAVLMANGYARLSGKVGVATITHGPALTNISTSLTDATRGSTPLVVLVGDTPAEMRDHSQNIEQREVVMPTGAGFEQMRSARTAVDDLTTAFRRAITEQRPIVLNIPREFNLTETEYQDPELRILNLHASTPDSNAIDVALGIIASAKRPVILAGRGATGPGAREAIIALADQIGAPLATTLQGQSLFATHPFNLGICGTLATDTALQVILQSDCIIAFGAGLNKFTTADGSLVDGKSVVHCDISSESIGRHVPVDSWVIGDARVIAETMFKWLQASEVATSSFRTEALKDLIASESPKAGPASLTPDTINAWNALIKLNVVLPAKRALVTDLGRFVPQAWKAIRVPRPSSYVHTLNFGAIGTGMGNAIGMCFAAQGEPVVLVTGDGGFMLNGLTEFNTAVRYRQDLIVVIINDNAYGAEHIQFKNRALDPSPTEFDWPDFSLVADALGGQGVTVKSEADLDGLEKVISDRTAPLLINVLVDAHSMGAGAPS